MQFSSHWTTGFAHLRSGEKEISCKWVVEAATKRTPVTKEQSKPAREKGLLLEP